MLSGWQRWRLELEEEEGVLSSKGAIAVALMQ
jgi:hypothetical protein